MGVEKNFENKIKKYLESKGAWFVKFFANAYTSSGIPDLLICLNGRFVGIEVKQETGKPSLLQKVHLKRIGEAGGIGILVYPSGYDDLKDLINNLSKDRNYKVDFNGEGYIEYRRGK